MLALDPQADCIIDWIAGHRATSAKPERQFVLASTVDLFADLSLELTHLSLQDSLVFFRDCAFKLGALACVDRF